MTNRLYDNSPKAQPPIYQRPVPTVGGWMPIRSASRMEPRTDELWVFIVGDDQSNQAKFQQTLSKKGYHVETFSYAVQFLEKHNPRVPGCVLVDLKKDAMSGLNIYGELAERCQPRPVVFVTEDDRLEPAVSAMKKGASDYLLRPIDRQTLLAAIKKAALQDWAVLEYRVAKMELMESWLSLTKCERVVFVRVAAGHINKRIAYDLDVTEQTIKAHRAHAMAKMRLRTPADFTHIAEQLFPAVLAEFLQRHQDRMCHFRNGEY